MRIILILLLLYAFEICAQPKELTREYILAGTVTSVGDTVKFKNARVKTETEFEIDAKGNKVNYSVVKFNQSGSPEVIVYFIEGKKYTVTSFEYNEKGMLASQYTVYTEKNSLLGSGIEYKYDSSSRLESIASYLGEKLSDMTVYSYDDKLNYMSVTEYDSDHSSTGSIEYYFNDKNFVQTQKNIYGNISSVTNYKYDGDIVYLNTSVNNGNTTNDRQEMKFDENGNTIQKSELNEERNSFVSFKAEYNKKGLPLRETGFDSKGKESWRYSWDYDDAGNKLSEEYSYEGNFASKTIYRYNSKGLLEMSAAGGKNINFRGKRTEYVYEYY